MKKKSKPIFNKKIGMSGYIIICVVLVLAAVVSTYVITIGGFESKDAFRNAKKYMEVESVIEKNFIGDVNEEDVYNGAAAAMVRSLGDKWSYYMTPAEYEAYKLSAANEYAGIGVTVQIDEDGNFRIASVQEGTPAEQAGLQEGQYLISVDGEEVNGMTLADVSTLIRSKLNTDFKLGIKDKKGNETEVTLACTTIYKTAVSNKLLEKNVGYVRIANFEAGSSADAISAIESLLSIGAEHFIFDLRDNPGGLLSELKALLDYILPEGDIFVSIDREGHETVTGSDKVCLKYDMCVLVNENTYSAAEFFAAALQEYDWASVVGAQTTGKARSQITVELSDGSAVHISTNKYLTPGRVDLAEAGGITPDYVVSNEVAPAGDEKPDEETPDTQPDADLQLEKALSLLTKKKSES